MLLLRSTQRYVIIRKMILKYSWHFARKLKIKKRFLIRERY